jgi:hypothetical protein
LVIPGGREPDWGPAGVAGGGPTVSTAATVSRRSTLRVRVSCPGACRVSAVARQGGRRVGRVARRGSGRLALRLRGVRRTSVRVVVRPAPARVVTVRRSVGLRG